MKLRKILTFLVIVCILVQCLIAIAPVSSFSQSSFKLNLSFDKPFYSTKDQFTLTVKLTNPTKEEIKNIKVTAKVNGRLEVTSLKNKEGENIKFTKSWTKKKLPPGETTFELTKKISYLGISEGAYRIAVTVKQNKTTIATENTALVVVNSHTVPILATLLVWNFHERARFNSEGTFLDSKIMNDAKNDFKNPGFYFAHINALFDHPGVSVNLNLSPLLIQQFKMIEKGCKIKEKNGVKEISEESEITESVSEILEELEGLIKAEQVEIIPGFFANLSPLNLTNEAWREDILFQIKKGQETVVQTFNLKTGLKGIYFPNLQANLEVLRFPMALRAGYAVLSINSLSDENELPDYLFAPCKITSTKGSEFLIFFSDTTILEEIKKHKDPESAAQTIIGLLAEIYLHNPNRQRLIVLALEDPNLRPDFALLEALYEKIEQTPWLRTLTFKQAEEIIPPSTNLLRFKENLKNPKADEYYSKVEKAKKEYEIFSKMIPLDHPLQEKLLNNLLIAESSDWLGIENSRELISSGLDFTNSISKTIDKELSKITISDSQAITLTSSQGKIPIIINNQTGYLVKATIELKSKDVKFPSGNSLQTVLSPKQNAFTFPVEVRTKKPSPIIVTLHYNEKIITQSTVLIKTTFLNESIRNIAIAFLLIICLLLGWRNLRKSKKKPRG